jgi:DNA-directed RNA polymerase subunit M/transcription elongation factor TFIIS
MSSSFPILVLTQKAEVKQSKLVCESVTLKDIQKYFKKKSEPEVLGTYRYKTQTLFLFGYTTGKAGTENKHELPPPHDGTLVFGDIIIIVTKDENSFSNPINFKVTDYEQFYSRAFGGFEDLDDDDDEDDDDDDDEYEDVEEENELNDDLDYASEHNEVEVEAEPEADLEVEVEVEEKKIKKKVINVNKIISIHPDKQLKVDSLKNSIREKTIDSIKTLLNLLSESEINELEQEIYKRSLIEAETKHIIKDWSIKIFVTVYLANVRKIVGNLDSASYVNNTELMKRYKNREITIEELCSMDYYELFASKWKDAIERQKIIEKQQLEGNKSMATDQFLCRKCFKRECTYYEMQTRSADEPMTIFINCLSCGNNWRQ